MDSDPTVALPEAQAYQRLKSIYLRVRALPPADQERAIAELCGADEALGVSVRDLIARETVIHGAPESAGSTGAVSLPEQLGRYHIRGLLGRGGMGVVLEGFDSELERSVAIKLLAPHLLESRPARARLVREARLLAELIHPHIATVHGLEQDGDNTFLVMERLKGRSLRALLDEGPLPAAQVVRLSLQISAALETAHRLGVVHRDLKPDNIHVHVDRNGAMHAKILDFGISKRLRADAAPSGHSTLSETEPGTIMGTAAYLSPEQARGLPVDARSDIWAFGCLLFEMVSGRKAFDASTVSDTITRILKDEPDYSLIDSLPPEVADRVLRSCLRKNVGERRQSIADVRIDLQAWDRGELVAAPQTEAAPAEPGPLALRPAVAATAAVLLLAAGWLLARANQQSQSGETAPTIQTIESLVRSPLDERMPAPSPDGRQFVFVQEDQGDLDVFLQRVDGSLPINLTAHSPLHDTWPSYSPDGDWIAFSSVPNDQGLGGGLYVMGATGESPTRVLDYGSAPRFAPNGDWLVFATEELHDPLHRSTGSRIGRVRTDGSDVVRWEVADGVGPTVSPNGRWVAYWGVRSGGQRDLFLLDFETRSFTLDEPDPSVQLTDDAAQDWSPFFGPRAEWLYFASDRGGSEDLWRLRLPEGAAAPGAPQRVTVGFNGLTSVRSSGDHGVWLAARRTTRTTAHLFEWLATGKAGSLLASFSTSGRVRELAVDANGDRVALATDSVLRVHHLRESHTQTVLQDEFTNREPFFSADENWLIFRSDRTGTYQVWAQRIGDRALSLLTGFEDGWNVLAAKPDRANDRLWLTLAKQDDWQTGYLDNLGAHLGNGRPADLDELILPEALSDFGLDEISPSGRWVLGSAEDRRDQYLAIDLESGDRHAVFGSYRDDVWPRFLDDSRVIGWNPVSARAEILDLVSGVSERVEGLHGPAKFEIVGAGQRLLATQQDHDFDVWILRSSSTAEPGA